MDSNFIPNPAILRTVSGEAFPADQESMYSYVISRLTSKILQADVKNRTEAHVRFNSRSTLFDKLSLAEFRFFQPLESLLEHHSVFRRIAQELQDAGYNYSTYGYTDANADFVIVLRLNWSHLRNSGSSKIKPAKRT